MDFDDIKVEEKLEESVIVLDAKEIHKIKNDNLKKALEMYKKGNVTRRAAAKRFSVCAETLKRCVLEDRQELILTGRNPLLSPEIEQQLVDWRNQSESFGCQLGRKQLQDAARFLTKELETKFTGSDGWLTRFGKRKGINLRNKIIDVKDWFSNVNRGLEAVGLDSVVLDPSRVWRCDQALLNIHINGDLEVNPRKGEVKYALFNFSAHGETLKPHLIDKGAPKRLTVAGVTAANTEDGNVTHEEFSRYLEEEFAPQLRILGIQFPIVLFLGPETTHDHIQVWQTAKQLGINLVTLHPDVTKKYEKAERNLLKVLGPKWRQIRNGLIESTKLRSNSANLAFILNQLAPICFTKSNIEVSFEIQELFPWHSSTNPNFIKIEPSLEIDQMNEIVEVTLERPLLFKCRACRREGDEDFVSMEEEGLSHVFKDLTGIVVDEDLSSFVCMKCKIQLESFANFRRLCLSSQEAFEAEKEVKDQLQLNEPNLVLQGSADISPSTTVRSIAANKPNPVFKVKEVDNIVCNECKKFFVRRVFLNHWFYTHKVDSEPSMCTECSKSLPSTYQLELHLRKKHGILKCIGCDRIDHVDARPNALRSHKTHMLKCTKFTENYTYECNLCGQKYPSPLQLDKHRPNCKGSKFIVCELCGVSVPVTYYATHQGHHNRVGRQYTCRYCPRTFKNNGVLLYHESSIHNPSNKPFHCAHCSLKFKLKHSLENHLKKKHFRPRPKKICKICGVAVSDLSKHITIHTGMRRFACEVPGCEARFRLQCSLRKHRYSHSKTRPFNCTLCSTGYYQTAYLRDHYKRTHGMVYAKGQTVPYRKGTSCVANDQETVDRPMDEVVPNYTEENMFFD